MYLRFSHFRTKKGVFSSKINFFEIFPQNKCILIRNKKEGFLHEKDSWT